MNGLNLHNIVRPAISAVHPDEPCVLYQAEGQKNTLGVVKAQYAGPKDCKVNFQPLGADTLAHLERIGDTKADEQIFLYSEPESPVSGTSRVPLLRSGDFVYRSLDNTWYLVTSVIEDWTARGWANAGVTQQVEPPDFTASEWYPMPLTADVTAEGEQHDL